MKILSSATFLFVLSNLISAVVEASYICNRGAIGDILIRELKQLALSSWETLNLEEFTDDSDKSFWRLHTHAHLNLNADVWPYFAVFDKNKRFIKVQQKFGPGRFKDCKETN